MENRKIVGLPHYHNPTTTTTNTRDVLTDEFTHYFGLDYLGSLDDEQFNALQAIYDNMILLSKEYTKEEIEKYLKDSFTNILRPIVAYAYRANPELIEPEFVLNWQPFIGQINIEQDISL